MAARSSSTAPTSIAGQTISTTAIASGQLIYRAPANASGNALGSFTFQVQDDGGTVNGGVDLDPSANVLTFNVAAVNDAPSGADRTLTTDINTAYVFSASDFPIQRCQRLAGQRPPGREDHLASRPAASSSSTGSR